MNKDSTVLQAIVVAKKRDLAAKKQQKSYHQLEQELASIRPFMGPGFFDALKARTPVPKIIAEVKRASPSKGVIRQNFSLEEINNAYQSCSNVVAISVLTEKNYFKGGDDVLAFFASNNTNNKPLLRKDFIFEPYQVLESKVMGAQAFLLIAALLDTKTLNQLVDFGLEIGIEPLVEAHNAEEMEAAKATNARVIGVNCRDLKTFKLDRQAHELLRGLDGGYAKIAESGIEDSEALRYTTEFSDAALIGSQLMAQTDIKSSIKALL